MTILARGKGTVCAFVHKRRPRELRVICALALLQVGLSVCGSRVHLGTAPFKAGAYTCSMQLVSIKAIIAMALGLVLSITGIAGNPNSFSSWTVLAAVAILPPLVVLWWWNDPRQTMSRSIQEALL